MNRRPWLRAAALAAALLVAGACATPTEDVGSLAAQPPLDCDVLVVGGAFLEADGASAGTFAPGPLQPPPGELEAVPIEAIVDVLARGAVFQRVVVEPDAARRSALGRRLRDGAVDAEVIDYLRQARLDGHDYLLVVERLQDGPIETQGTNGRWPVTFATWILLGVGAFIPDRTFESRATLRLSLRDLQDGRAVHDPLLLGGPVELSLLERTDVLGVLASVVVPPFWVGDDTAAVRQAVRTTTEQRLLSSLVRDLKGGSLRQRLRERAAAELTLAEAGGESTVVVRAPEALGSARLRADGVDAAAAAAFARRLLASERADGRGLRYEAALPGGLAGQRLQVLVATLRGDVASATFVPGGRR